MPRTPKRDYHKPAKRYQNDLRAIRKATGTGYREAQGLYRQVRDLAGRRPARARIVKSAKIKVQLRRDFDERQAHKPAPAPPGKPKLGGTVTGAFSMGDMVKMLKKFLGLGLEIAFDLPFASYDIDKVDPADEPEIESQAAAAYIYLWPLCYGHLRSVGTIKGDAGRAGRTADGSYAYDFAYFVYEYSRSLGQCSITWDGP